MTRRTIVAGLCSACFWLGAVEPTEKSLSINFAAGRQNAPNVSVVSGLGEYGVYPVVGDCWNNVSATVASNLTGFVWSDGQAVEGVAFSCKGSYWSVTATPEHNNIMSSFFDCWSKPSWVQVDGLTRANGLSGDCTLYLYYTCDGGNTIWAPSVNGTRYTYANGAVVEGDAAWGSLAVARTGQLVEGTDYMKLERVPLTDEGVIRIETSGSSDATIRGPFAALQFVFRSPQLAVTCDEQAGDVRIDDGAAAPSVVKNVAMGELVTSSVTAIPAHGYRFSQWTGDTSIITEGSVSSATITVSTDARRRLKAVFEPITPFTYVLSVNFTGGRSGNTEYCPIVGSGTFGAVPVVGTCWNNISAPVTENLGNLKWNDAVTVRGVTESNTASLWSLGTSKGVDNLFYGYMDDNNTTSFAGLTRENGFPTNCTVYIYNSTDSKNLYFCPMTVNGTTYTFADGAVRPGTTRWGSTTKAQSNVLELGGDYLRIDNVLIPESGTIEIAPYRTGFTAQTARGGVAAIQIVFDMSAEYAVRASCDPEQGTVQFNDDPAGAAVEVVGSHDGAFQTTLRAIPAPGYVFSRWTGNTGVIVGSVEAAEVLVASQLPVRLTAVFVPDTMPFTATWVGNGERGNLADPANWRCLSSGGNVLANTLPGDRTDVTIAGNVVFDWPEGQTLAFRSLTMNCTLADDCDWRGFDARGFGGTVDVKGHVLAVDSFAGAGTITDSAVGEAPGELRIAVAEGLTVTNATVTITGGVRVVKDGAGLFVAAKGDQAYTGGTDIAAGAFMLATKQHPMGVGDGTQNVTVRAGATLQIGNQVSSTGCVYNYVDLAGTIRVSGTAEGDAWNSAYCWHNAITLAADARIEGGWFWFGHNQLTRTLSLNGHTLTLHLTTGEAYVYKLKTDSTGGRIVVDAGSIQVGDTDDFSSALLEFQGAAYVFLSGNLIVKDFKYATNKWRAHGVATQVFVSGTYHAGLNRPPVQLQDGAVLDLSEQTGCWSADGQAATTGGSNRTFTTTGLVTFAPGAAVRVDVGERELVAGLKLVQWATAPGEDVSFELASPQDGMSLDHNEFELFVSVDTEPVIGVWTGLGDPANPADPANWACTNKLGQAVGGRIPVPQTHVVLPEGGTFNFPADAAIVCNDVRLPSMLGGDSDLSGLIGPCGGTIDLQGHSLTMSQLVGQATITDTSTGTPGEFHVNVPAGATVNNTTYALTGNLRLVKDGAGTLVVSKPNQSYLGGTEVAAGTLQLGTNQNPMGTGDGTKDVTVRAGAAIDINRCYSSTTGVYNYSDLAGTIRISGSKEGDAWNTAYFWHNAISLAADVRIEGGWFYLGHNQLARMLALNGHTLTLHLTTGEAFSTSLKTDSTGGKIIVDAGSLQASDSCDFSAAVEFRNAAYIFLTGQGAVVKDFKYAVNKWRTHANATQVFVSGTYHAGLNRPPILLQNGSTLDLSEQAGCWTADGQAPVTGANNRTFTTPGKVSFEPGGQIVVDLGTREFSQNERVKVVAWSAAPEGTTFRLAPERMKDLKLIANDEGLWAYREGGLVVIFR